MTNLPRQDDGHLLERSRGYDRGYDDPAYGDQAYDDLASDDPASDDRGYDTYREGFAARDDWSSGGFGTGLANVGFIRAALRRQARLWCAIAAAGLLAGLAGFVARPSPRQASTSLLLTQPPGATTGWIADDQVLAQSRSVAGIALRRLGMRTSPASFVQDYAVTTISDRVLVITVQARSGTDAVRAAAALATAFLAYRAHLLRAQQTLVEASLQQQVARAKQNLSSIVNRAERNQASSRLTVLEQTVIGNDANLRSATTAAVQDSTVLDPAALISQHSVKRIALFTGGGLLAGLALGMGIVVVIALTSDRLRRRDDIARVLGTPVTLSVAQRRSGRRRFVRGRAAAQAAVRRIAAHLDSALPPRSDGCAAMAVVPVDDTQIPAQCLVSLAISRAQQGSRVVLADLCAGAPAGRLLGVTDPGVHDVSKDGVNLVVVVSAPDDMMPAGPLRAARGQNQASGPLAAACESADLLVTLVTLDPSHGAEHIPGWASDAVVVVTAGRSSVARIYAVGEMIRLACVSLNRAVLIGADPADESLGVPDSARTSPGSRFGGTADIRARRADMPRTTQQPEADHDEGGGAANALDSNAEAGAAADDPNPAAEDAEAGAAADDPKLTAEDAAEDVLMITGTKPPAGSDQRTAGKARKSAGRKPAR